MTKRVLFVGLLALVLFPALASGALLSQDPNALSAWHGRQTYDVTDGYYRLNVAVDYAVYAPGSYNAAGDPSGGTEYVYAYEIINTVNSSSVEVSTFGVGIAPGAVAGNIGVDITAGAPGLSGGILTSQKFFATSGAHWGFDTNLINPGDYSTILLFTSPQAPQWMTGSVADGGLSQQQDLPSPLPEPATFGFLALGGLIMIFKRRRARKGK
jgi:hypothetical protein